MADYYKKHIDLMSDKELNKLDDTENLSSALNKMHDNMKETFEINIS